MSNLFNSIIMVQGKIFWNNGRRRINLKRAIRDVFEPLESNESMEYKMELCLNKQKVIDRAKELVDDDIIPVLFYFVRGDNNEVS
jgi:hypothetical protein